MTIDGLNKEWQGLVDESLRYRIPTATMQLFKEESTLRGRFIHSHKRKRLRSHSLKEKRVVKVAEFHGVYPVNIAVAENAASECGDLLDFTVTFATVPEVDIPHE